jgi:hypothetical protein
MKLQLNVVGDRDVRKIPSKAAASCKREKAGADDIHRGEQARELKDAGGKRAALHLLSLRVSRLLYYEL